MADAAEEVARVQENFHTLLLSHDVVVVNATAADFSPLKQALLQLRDKLDMVNTFNGDQNAAFWNTVLVDFIALLKHKTRLQAQSTTENDVRYLALDILNRLPNHEVQRQHHLELMEAMMDIVTRDNEENAVAAMKKVMELHKTFKGPDLERHVQPLLEFVRKLYCAFPIMVEHHFKQSSMGTGQPMTIDAPQAPDQQQEVKQLVMSDRSFKVLTDSPLIVVILLQSYSHFARGHLPVLLEAMVTSLHILLPQPQQLNATQKQAYADLVTSQVKTASFLTYALRAYTEPIQRYKDDLPKCVIELLFRCPKECLASRRELFVVMRHIFDTDLREKFAKHVDHLLSDMALLGESPSSLDSLRNLAYNTMADLIHHVRGKLTVEQISQAVAFFTRNMYDPSFSLNIQIMSAKLLVHLVERVFKMIQNSQSKDSNSSTPTAIVDDPTGGSFKTMLISIMLGFVAKFNALQKVYPTLRHAEALAAAGAASSPSSSSPTPHTFASAHEDDDPNSTAAYILMDKKADQDTWKEFKTMVKTLILGLKNVIYVLLTIYNTGSSHQAGALYQQSLNSNNQESVQNLKRLSADEVKIFVRLFKTGISCFRTYCHRDGHEDIIPAEEKENLENFASLFTHLDARTFTDIVSDQLPYLYDCLVENIAFQHIPVHFIASTAVSKTFVDILLAFLVKRMDRLADVSTPKAIAEGNVQLKLLKLIFIAPMNFANNIESVKAYMSVIVTNCLKYSIQHKNSAKYFQILMALVRCVQSSAVQSSKNSGNKGGNDSNIDHLQNEFQQYSTPIIDRLATVLKHSVPSPLHEVYIELCLKLPFIIKSFPMQYFRYTYLPVLFQCIHIALKSNSPELIHLGLSEFDKLIEKLRPDVILPLLPLLPELLEAVCKHLRPSPFQQGMAALRILAKLGGRNRKASALPDLVSTIEYPDSGMTLTLKFLDQRNGVVRIKKEDLGFVSTPTPAIAAPDIDEQKGPQTFVLEPGKYFTQLFNAIMGNIPDQADAAFKVLKVFLITLLDLDFSPMQLPVPEKKGETALHFRPELGTYACNNFYNPYGMDFDGSQTFDEEIQCLDETFPKKSGMSPMNEDMVDPISVEVAANKEDTTNPTEQFFLNPKEDYISQGRMEAQNTQFGWILNTIFAYYLRQDFQDLDFIRFLCHHFAFIFMYNKPPGTELPRQLHRLNPDLFLEAIVHAFVVEAESEAAQTKDQMACPLCSTRRLNASSPKAAASTTFGSSPAGRGGSFGVTDFSPSAPRGKGQDLFSSSSFPSSSPIGATPRPPDTPFGPTLGGKGMPDQCPKCLGPSVPYFRRDASTLLEEFMHTFQVMCTKDDNSIDEALLCHFTVWDKLAAKFMHSCYQREWSKMLAACRGLSNMIRLMPASWVRERDMKEWMKALLFVAKDSPAHIAVYTVDEAASALQLFIKVIQIRCTVTTPRSGTQPPKVDIARKDLELLFLLVCELTSPYKQVRRVVRGLLDLISEVTDVSVVDLLSTFQSDLLQSITLLRFQRLTQPRQTGICSALAYFLSHEPPIFPVFLNDPPTLNEELINILSHCYKFVTQAPLVSKSLNSLDDKPDPKRAYLLLLAQAIKTPSIVTSSEEKCQNLKINILTHFFRLLLTTNQEESDIAKSTLESFRTIQPFPVLLLSTSLDPLFRTSLDPLLRPLPPIPVQDSNKVTVHMLCALSDILRLCPSLFDNNDLGERLIQLLTGWADSPMHLPQSKGPGPRGDDRTIAARALDIFPFLNDSHTFLPQLVLLVVKLEKAWGEGCEKYSPFRHSLAQLLKSNMDQARHVFLQHITSTEGYYSSVFQLLLGIFKQPEAKDLCLNVMDHQADILAHTFHATTSPDAAKHRGVLLMKAFAKVDPCWLIYDSTQPLMRKLEELWDAEETQRQNIHKSQVHSTEATHDIIIQRTRAMVKIFIKYLRGRQEQLSLVFKIVQVFGYNSSTDYGFLHQFLVEEFVKFPIAVREKALLHYFANIFPNREDAVHAMVHAIFPMMKHALSNGDQLLGPSMMVEVFGRIEAYISSDPPQDALATQMIYFTSLLLQRCSASLMDQPLPSGKKVREVIITLGKECIKSENMNCKHAAYLLCVAYIQSYPTPKDTVHAVYRDLLKSPALESKPIVKKCLNNLVAAVAMGNAEEGYDEETLMTWTKDLLLQEGTTQQLIHILQCVERHRSLFFPHRQEFAYRIVSTLVRIGLGSSHPYETRKIALDLTDVIIEWEEHARQAREEEAQALAPETSAGIKAEEVKTEPNTGEASTKKPSADNNSLLVDHQITFVVSFLLRLMSPPFTEQRRTENAGSSLRKLCEKCVRLVQRILTLWPNMQVEFESMNKLLQASSENLKKWTEYMKSLPSGEIAPISSFGKDEPLVLCAGLDVLTIFLEAPHTQPLVLANAGKLNHFLSPFFECPNQQVTKRLANFCTALLKISPCTPKEKPNVIHQNIQYMIHNSMSHLTTRQPDSTPSSRGGRFDSSKFKRIPVFSCLSMLQLYMAHSQVIFNEYVHRLSELFLGLVLEMHKLQEILQQAQIQLQQLQHQAQPSTNSRQQQQHLFSQIQKGQDTYSDCRVSLLKIMDIMASSLLAPDVKKEFYKGLQMILEDCSDEAVILKVMKMVEGWMTLQQPTPPKGDPTPPPVNQPLSSKEKVQFLTKMIPIDKTSSKRQGIRESFFRMVNYLFTEHFLNPSQASFEPTIIHPGSSTEFHTKVMAAFITSLRITSLRHQFLETLNTYLPPNINDRLAFILQPSHWEPICDTFWVSYALDLILSCLDAKIPLSLGPGCARIAIKSDVKPAAPPAHSPKGSAILKEHADYMTKLAKMNMSDLLLPLRQLIGDSHKFSFPMWVDIFPCAWESLRRSDQQSLGISMIDFLKVMYHQKQYRRYPNVVQALLKGVLQCTRNPIYIPPDILKFCGQSFRAWNIVIPMLERRFLVLEKSQARGVDGGETLEHVCGSLTEQYRTLGEEDLVIGTWRSHGITRQLARIYSLGQCAQWGAAQEMMKSLLDAYCRGWIVDTPGDRTWITGSELALWEDHNILIAKKLGQWDEVHQKYAQQVGTTHLLLECHWNRGEWQKMREVFNKHQRAQIHLLRMYHISQNIMEDRLNDADNIFQQAAQSALQMWCALPSFKSSTHLTLLHNFQQLLELSESVNMLAKLNVNVQNVTSNDIKSWFLKWRERVPNQWDDVANWSELLTWRQHIFKRLHQQLAPHRKEMNLIATYALNEALWTLNKLAKVARKNKLYQLAHLSLQDATAVLEQMPTRETPENFAKNFERLKWYYQQPDPKMKEYGLLEVMKVESKKDSSEKFAWSQKIDILRLRAQFLMALDRNQEAHEVFQKAVQTYYEHLQQQQQSQLQQAVSKTFYHWGRLCDQMFQASGHTSAMWGENALACFFTCLGRQIPGVPPHKVTPRILWLLAYGTEQNSFRSLVEKSLSDQHPAWVWIPWVPNLFAGLHRREGVSLKDILIRLTHQHAQALYYYFRTTHVELRELSHKLGAQQRSTAGASTPTAAGTTAKPPFDQASKTPTTSSATTPPTTHQTGTVASPTATSPPAGTPGAQTRPTSTAPSTSSLMAVDGASNGDKPAATPTTTPTPTTAEARPASASSPGIGGNGNAAEAEANRASSPPTGQRSPVTAGSPMGFRSGQQAPGAQPAPMPGKDILSLLQPLSESMLKRLSTTLYQDLERITQELTGRLKVEQEEGVLRCLSAILRKCYTYNVYHPPTRPFPSNPPAPLECVKGTDIPLGIYKDLVDLHHSQLLKMRTSFAQDLLPEVPEDDEEKKAKKREREDSKDGSEGPAKKPKTPDDSGDGTSPESTLNSPGRNTSSPTPSNPPSGIDGVATSAAATSTSTTTTSASASISASSTPSAATSSSTSSGVGSPQASATSHSNGKSNSKQRPSTLLQLIRNLKKWISELQAKCHALPSTLPLQHLSRQLIDHYGQEVEVPGQYNSSYHGGWVRMNPMPDQHEKIMCFLPNVDLVRRNDSSCRRVTLQSHSGRRFRFLLQTTAPYVDPAWARSEERVWNLTMSMNHFLEKRRDSKKRHVRITAPVVVPLSPRVRLFLERAQYETMQHVYQEWCCSVGKNVDYPLQVYWYAFNKATATMSADKARERAFEAVARLVPDNIFEKYMHRVTNTFDSLFTVRKNFTIQTGLWGLLNHLLCIRSTSTSLHNLTFGVNTGEVVLADYGSTYDKDQHLSFNSNSFRLTRNVTKFITKIGIEGQLQNSMFFAVNALAQHQEHLICLLRVFLKDDLDTFRNPRDTSSEIAHRESIHAKVEHNTQSILNRLTSFVSGPAFDGNPVEPQDQFSVPPLNHHVEALIHQAQSISTLSTVDAPHMPWF